MMYDRKCWRIWNTLQWRHNEHDGVSNQEPHDCLLNSLFRRRSKKTPKLRITGLCERNSRVTGEFPAQSNAEKVSIWWRHHDGTVIWCQFYHGSLFHLWGRVQCRLNKFFTPIFRFQHHPFYLNTDGLVQGRNSGMLLVEFHLVCTNKLPCYQGVFFGLTHWCFTNLVCYG